ncbi:MAG: hypothetical protein AAGC53_07225 [Actinomycetota bacterium]
MLNTRVSPTEIIVRLAGELMVDGVTHPVAAAVARAARIHALAAPTPFAARLGIDELSLRRAESGVVSFDQLPAAYLAFVDGIEVAVDLVSLRELAAAIDGRSEPVTERVGVVLAFPAMVGESVA